MIGILIVSHGSLCKAMLDSSEMIIGKQSNTDYLELHCGDDVDIYEKKFIEKIKNIDCGSGVIVFTDIYGGTPANIAIKNLKNYNYEVITGASLAMLIEAYLNRMHSNIEDLKESCINAAMQSIKDVRSIMKLNKVSN